MANNKNYMPYKRVACSGLLSPPTPNEQSTPTISFEQNMPNVITTTNGNENELTPRRRGRKAQTSNELPTGSKTALENAEASEYFQSIETDHTLDFCQAISMPFDLEQRHRLCMLAAINIYFNTIVYTTHDELFAANSDTLKQFKKGLENFKKTN